MVRSTHQRISRQQREAAGRCTVTGLAGAQGGDVPLGWGILLGHEGSATACAAGDVPTLHAGVLDEGMIAA